MIKSKLKAKNCNRGQLFRPGLVSSAQVTGLDDRLTGLADHPLNALHMVMTSDETQILFFADRPMSHAKRRETKDNRKNPEYHVAVVMRRLLSDKTVPQTKPC